MLTQQLLKDGINKQKREIESYYKSASIPWYYEDTKAYVKDTLSFKTAVFELIACSRYLLMK